jgi:hypothetical protein
MRLTCGLDATPELSHVGARATSFSPGLAPPWLRRSPPPPPPLPPPVSPLYFLSPLGACSSLLARTFSGEIAPVARGASGNNIA